MKQEEKTSLSFSMALSTSYTHKQAHMEYMHTQAYMMHPPAYVVYIVPTLTLIKKATLSD